LTKSREKREAKAENSPSETDSPLAEKRKIQNLRFKVRDSKLKIHDYRNLLAGPFTVAIYVILNLDL
jgi:hypothetical protein